jgi:hypothetical protein
MAVGPELAGSQVRCPHCLQVVVAPTTVGPDESVSGNPFQFAESAQEANDRIGTHTDAASFTFSSSAESLPETTAGPDPTSELQSSDLPTTAGPTSRGPANTAGGRPNWLLTILVPYAVFMTVMAIFYFIKYSSVANETPLDQIPDLLGQFQQKQAKGSPQSRSVPLPPPDQNLPGRLLTSLGKPIQVGAIEVTPLAVEYRPWTAFTKIRNRYEPRKVPIKATLVMHLRLRNVSPDLTFYPTDPYFDRNPKQANDKPYTLLDVGGRKYYGGLIEFVAEPGNTERTWIAGQENDDKPLGPGEARETVLVSRPGDALFDAVQKAKEPAVWRIHVRRGLMPYHGTEIPVSAVVGVSFTAADIRKSG